MTSNSVYNKLVNFALSEISFRTFELMLKESTKSNPIRVEFKTIGTTGNGPHKDYYWMYWDSAAYVGGSAGGSDTKAAENMVNIQCLGLDGDWRTLNLNTVTKCRFNGQTFRVK